MSGTRLTERSVRDNILVSLEIWVLRLLLWFSGSWGVFQLIISQRSVSHVTHTDVTQSHVRLNQSQWFILYGGKRSQSGGCSQSHARLNIAFYKEVSFLTLKTSYFGVDLNHTRTEINPKTICRKSIKLKLDHLEMFI